MIWFLTTLAALAAAFYIAAPFYRESALRTPAGAPLRARQRELESQRESLLRDLKELEFDRRMGKVDAGQYARARANATREAAAVLRQIEALHEPAPTAASAATARRARATNPASPNLSRLDLEIELEVAVARARKKLTRQVVPPNWACSCGRVMAVSDRFCASCGQERQDQGAVAQGAAVI